MSMKRGPYASVQRRPPPPSLSRSPLPRQNGGFQTQIDSCRTTIDVDGGGGVSKTRQLRLSIIILITVPQNGRSWDGKL